MACYPYKERHHGEGQLWPPLSWSGAFLKSMCSQNSRFGLFSFVCVKQRFFALFHKLKQKWSNKNIPSSNSTGLSFAHSRSFLHVYWARDNLAASPRRGSAPPHSMNLLAAIIGVFQLVAWAQTPTLSPFCPFRTFRLYFVLKLFTLIKLCSDFWQSPVPRGNSLKVPH